MLRSSERLAFSTLKLALPGYMILAQVPIARFLNVPKRNSYAEWMRRLGSQCVDFVICDVTSQVIAVVEIRPPIEQISEKLRARLDRVERVLEAANIPVHVWNEERLPTIEAARDKLLPRTPAVPASMAKKPLVDLQPLTTGAAVVMAERGGGRRSGGRRGAGQRPVRRHRPRLDPGRSDRGPRAAAARPGSTSSRNRSRRCCRRRSSAEPADAQLSSACANSRARKVCRSASFSPTPMK